MARQLARASSAGANSFAKGLPVKSRLGALDPFISNATLKAPTTALSQQQQEVHMQLLPEELRALLPPLYTQDGNKNPTVYAKFFTPDSNWTWFVTEGGAEGEDFVFFGYVIGFEAEWGYFALSELESAQGPLKLPIERDLHFQPGPWSEVKARYERERGEQA
jgi:hypothetical protein